MPSECLGKTKEWQYYWEVYIRTIGDDDAIFSLNSLICNRTRKVVGEEDGIVLPARGIEGGFEQYWVGGYHVNGYFLKSTGNDNMLCRRMDKRMEISRLKKHIRPVLSQLLSASASGYLRVLLGEFLLLRRSCGD